MNIKSNRFKRVGVLGGTFDPPHEGHIEISKAAIKKLKLSLIIWAVTKRNPLKKSPTSSLKKIIALSKRKINKIKNITVKSYDNLINSSKTIDLVKHINKHGDSNIFFLMGSDSLVNFHKWHQWQEIAKLAKLVVFPRLKYLKKARLCKALKILGKKKILFMKTKIVDISSSKLRKNYLR